jgi:hypothetical protein
MQNFYGMLLNEQEKKQSRLCGLFPFPQPVAPGFSSMEQDLEIPIGVSITMLFTRLILSPQGTVIVVTCRFIWFLHKTGRILLPRIPHFSKPLSRYPVH